ncbi:hypothetical protein MM326_18460 [Alkalihalobacillus sp. LMS6]|uniref:hypothetical protein n=1 Tax=Alkalihalobacillus sp. LMS6 TaxID=2924034 RepID=UPI0020D0A393|nr:hypothetical protein [Alkalihalobacillus sp. LMS6]UTR06036.1 hypothetical protein MM326_18460 [Alkalihalobacillus sp. LMS6]
MKQMQLGKFKMKRASVLTAAAVIMAVPLYSISNHDSGFTQVAKAETATGSIVEPEVHPVILYPYSNDNSIMDVEIRLAGNLTVPPDNMTDELIFTVQLPSDMTHLFGTDVFNENFQLTPNLTLLNEDGELVSSYPAVSASDLTYNETNHSFSFNLTQYLESHDLQLEGTSHRVDITTRFPVPVEGNEGEHFIQSALSLGYPKNLDHVYSTGSHTLTLVGNEDDTPDPNDDQSAPDEDDIDPPSLQNRSLLDWQTQYEVFYTGNLGSLSLNSSISEPVTINTSQIDNLTYTLQLPDELGHLLKSEEFRVHGLFGLFDVPLVGEDSDLIFYEMEDPPISNEFVYLDHVTNSIHVHLQEWVDLLGYQFSDEAYLHTHSIQFNYPHDSVTGTHVIKTAYTDGMIDLAQLDNQPNELLIDFDSGKPTDDGSPDDGNDDEDHTEEPKPDSDDSGDKEDKEDKKDNEDQDDKSGTPTPKNDTDNMKKDDTKDVEEGGRLPNTATNYIPSILGGMALATLGFVLRLSTRLRSKYQ